MKKFKQRCEICGRKARKAIVVMGYRMFTCNSCLKPIADEASRNDIRIVRTEFDGSPKGSLRDYLDERWAIEQMIEQSEADVFVLWIYPHSDWELAVDNGLTNRASYQEFADVVQAAKSEAERQ